MYELTRISLHNWYLIDVLDIPIASHAAVIGQTGAGKSSVLDAIQTVISGNNRNALELNAAAGEHKGRSVRDYCLGCVSDVNEGKARRERCESTLVLTLFDREKDKKIAIGVLLKAEVDQLEVTRRFLIEDYDFKIEEFIRDGKVVTHSEIIDAVKQKVGDKGFRFYPNSTKFVGAYLEIMRPGMPPDPKRFLRSFSNALQAKEMSDPTDFVRRFVLEPMPLDVDSVRSSMSIWKELTEEVKRLEAMISDLSVIDRNFQKGFQAKVQQTDLSALETHMKLVTAQLEVDGLKKGSDKIKAEAYEVINQIAIKKEELSDLLAEEDALNKRIIADDMGAQIALLDAQAETAMERRTSLGKAVESDLARLRELRFLEGLKDTMPDAGKIAESAKQLSAMTLDKVPEELALRATEITEKAADITGLEGVISSLHAFSSKLTERKIDMRRKIEEHSDATGGDGNQTRPFSRQVTRFMDALDSSGIRCQCLPDMVDMNDTGWAFALESLLGPNREAILINDDKDLSAAFDILYRNRNEYDGVRLIDTRKLRRMNPRRGENSIASVVSTNNSDIQAFLDYSVGRFSRAETEGELDHLANGIMRNGKTSSGVTKRVFRDRATILGKRAQQRAVADSKIELDRLKEDMGKIERQIQQIAALTGRCQRAMEVDPQTISENLKTLTETVSNLRGLNQRKQTMDAPDLQDAHEKLEEVKAKIASLKPEVSSLETKKNQYDVKRALYEQKTSELQDNLPGIEQELLAAQEQCKSPLITRLRETVSIEWPSFPVTSDDIADLMDQDPNEAAVKASQLSTILKEFSENFKSKGDAEAFVKRGTNGVLSYAQKWMLENAPLSEEHSDEDRFFWTSGQLEKYRDHELLKYRDRLEEARRDMETSLREGLISKLGEQFALMEQQIDGLNRRLARYEFVGQTYQFRSSVAARFLPIFELVQAQKNLALDEAMDEEDDRFSELEELFQSDEKDAKLFEDYRQYFNFELFIEHPDPKDPSVIVSIPFSSVIGKLSGGQRQAPYYVAIAASMVTAYYPKAGPGDTEGMGLLVFDEAFNKLDIPNTQRLMDLFRSLGLQVVVAAPEEKRPSLIECVDSVISVSRMPGSEDVFIDMASIGRKAKAAMLDENPVHKPVPA